MGGALILSIVTFIIIYVNTFNKDFKKEDIDRVVPLLSVLFIVILLFNIMGMLSS